MKKFLVLGLGVCMMFAFSSCKSKKESAYKTAYDQAKQQELVQGESQASEPIEIAPVTSKTTSKADATYRTEKVVLASGAAGSLKAFSVVCGSFGVKANAEGLKAKLDADGYNAKVVFNADRNMYRVVVSSFDDRVQAAQARDNFKAKYPSNPEFQKSWLLYAK